jgi:competence protein ComEC
VISAGWKNRFRFPHPDVLKRYNHRGYRIFRVDTLGAVTLITDGQNLAIKPFFQITGRD